MSTKNRAKKSTGTRALLNSPQSNSSNRTLRQRGSVQNNNSSTQRDSSDSDDPPQPLHASTPASSRISTQASTSRVAAGDSDADEQSTVRLSNERSRNFRRIRAAKSDSDTTSDSDEAPGRDKPIQGKNTSKKRQRIVRRKNSSSEASDEDFQPSPSTSRASSRSVSSLNQTVSSPNRTILTAGNLANLVNKCVYYLLIADQKKCTIKRRDIQKHVFAAPEAKFYNEVLKQAGEVLKKVYGIEIVAVENRKGEYLLINHLSDDLGIQEFIDYSPQELQKRGFIFYLLTIIFMNGRSITDVELAAALKPLGVDLNSRTPNQVFGDVSKYMKELASQNYIECHQTNKDPPEFEYTWGERAYQEVDKKDLLDFACEIFGDTRPENWILQYNDAMARRQEPA